MTHQNHQTNGASLEDCHTNFFALTELYGIKWRKLVWGETSGGGEGEEGAAPLADPVISSYARCLAGDILCVWRRVPAPAPPDLYEMTTPTPPPLSLRAAKELWIFWYGEEPDLNGLVAPELIASQGEQGSWESGLSYECRSLLFKALHNLIERCLLSRDFVRLGKWFVQPYDGDEEDAGKSPWHLSFSFAFFLHGESTVCASVDVRQHPPVRTLTAKRLAKINSLDNQSDAKVILAPFGLEGTLTGRWWEEGAGAGGAGRVLEAWRQLYPLEQGCGAVEVALGGARMRYPRPYVLLTELCAPPARPDPPPPLGDTARLALAAQSPDTSYGDANGDKSEDFVDPTRKTPCTCAKWRRRRAPRPPPFHRRRPAPLRGHAHRPTSGCACSPGSMSGSPAPGGSAPPSAGAPPPSPHPAPHPHLAHLAHLAHLPTAPHQESSVSQSSVPVPTTLHTPAPTPDPLAPPTPAPPALPPPRAPAQCEGWVGSVSRRPVLCGAAPRLDALEDDHELHMLYDYSTVYAWLEHPVKRFKSDENRFREEMALGSTGGDLYAGHDHTTMAAMPDHTLLDVKLEKPDHNDDSKEYKNLFTSDGLCPTFKDLEQIFDNSDDAASGDETVRLAQAAGAAESKCLEERCGRGCPRAEELSKMFPTPPSMEAHAQPSPGFTLPDDLTACATRLPPQGSPPPDAPIEDWSYVFKPPQVYKYVGSSKYAPLTSLPSSLLPPVSLPPHAVYTPRPAPAHRHRDEPEPAPDSVGVKRSVSPPAPRAPQCAGAGGGSPRRGAAPPACPLMLNVLLADTVLNVFRDHNFDSCTLCVCNAGPKMVGNILGADAATYLPGVAQREDEPSRCTCGFSAILNRRLAHRAGLFYEDEMEITGVAEEPGRGSGGALAEVARGVLAACAALPGGAGAALGRAPRARHADLRLNLLEYLDGGAAAARALRAATAPPPAPAPAPDHPPLVHRWPFIGARAPRSSRDVVRLMRRLRPLLQDAIQKRCCGARMWDGVSGPLTWRQFHRLAGRGNEDLCEPQPVPPLVVGHEREWVSVAPPALRHWERLALEPYAYARHVRYAALAHDAPALRDSLGAFFRDLAAAYEACRLGVHRPATHAPHGLVHAAPLVSDSPDEWAGVLPAGNVGAALRGLAQALRSLVPVLHSDPPDSEDALVIYLVEPPAPPHQRHLVLRALLRLAARAQEHLHRHNPLVKLVSVEALWARGGGAARALAFSVYTGARRLLHHRADGKSLTGFGTAARDNLFIQAKDEKNRCPYALWSPAWVLAAPRTRCGAEVAESWGGGGGGAGGGAAGGVLFLAYCLSHDQRWLLAAASDARGELLDTAAINVHVPQRARRARAPPARRLGLAKLMDWTLALMSQTAQPWRLVVGRVGRIGHGELKGWSWLLSRKHLERASSTLRELCGACAAVPGAAPGVLSACLVSTEPDSRLRLMADRFTPDERFSQASIQSHLHTPRDVSATHILVFPTSATTQSNPMTFEQPLANGEDGDMSMFLNVDMGDEDMGEDNMADLLIGDMFNSMWAPGSPRRAEEEGAASPLPHLPHLPPAEPAEPLGAVLQQPLALGYLVSTAPLPAMPRWWWAAAHHLHDACPAFLKTALHLHSADDYSLTARAHRHDHPLDSQTTTDVLRYVLEGYNALSWLTLDTNTHDRLSCLPLHVQVLMQLYHTAAAIG